MIVVHDAEFRQAEKDFYSFVTALTGRLIEIDDTIPELPVKDLVSPAGRIDVCTHRWLITWRRTYRSFACTGMCASRLTRPLTR